MVAFFSITFCMLDAVLAAAILGLVWLMRRHERTREVLVKKERARADRLASTLEGKIERLRLMTEMMMKYENTPEVFYRKVSAAVFEAGMQDNFDDLLAATDERFGGLVERLRVHSPTLSQTDVVLCCMICLGFSNNQIGVVLGHSNSKSVFNRRHKLRAKLGLATTYGSLEKWLEDIKRH